jgi:hypothetical protein
LPPAWRANKIGLFCAAIIGALLGTIPGRALAATEVRGQLDDIQLRAIQLRAENASTREVLDALSATFKLSYELPPNIGREATGLYSGAFIGSWPASWMGMTISLRFGTTESRLRDGRFRNLRRRPTGVLRPVRCQSAESSISWRQEQTERHVPKAVRLAPATEQVAENQKTP